MSSLAARTREAVRADPVICEGLRAGVVNYTAAARYLDVEGDVDAVATALRRFADELDTPESPAGQARVSMESGLGQGTDEETAHLVVGDSRFVAGAGSLTAIVATGTVPPDALTETLGRLRAADVDVEAAAADGETMTIVVERRDGPNALRVVEAAVGKQ